MFASKHFALETFSSLETWKLESFQDFLFDLEMKPCMHLKYQFWKNVTSEEWNSGTLNTFGHFLSSFWAWLLNTVAITPKSEDKKCPKVFNVSEFHFSEVTFFQNWYFNNTRKNNMCNRATWFDLQSATPTAKPHSIKMTLDLFQTEGMLIPSLQLSLKRTPTSLSLLSKALYSLS